MIKAGEGICPYCASKLTSAFYAVTGTPVGALLTQDKDGRYQAEAYQPGTDAPPDVEYVLIDEDALMDGMPENIFVKEKKRGISYMMERCCPECKKLLPPSYGKLPTFIIDVVGSITGGKTAWLGSLAFLENNIHAGVAGFPCNIVIQNTDVSYAKSGATTLLEQGNTLYAHLKRKKDDMEYAIVVLRDFAGELLHKDAEDSSIGASGDVVSVIRFMSKSDAFLFVTDETSDIPSHEAQRNQAFQLLDSLCLAKKKAECKAQNKPAPPFGVILSHADKMMEGSEKVRTTKQVRQDGETLAIPLLTKDTFACDTDESYEMKNLLPRIELEDTIAMQCSAFARLLRLNGTAQKSFIVKSCVSMSEQENDYRDGINVYDPLLWVLNRLRLFPLQ